MSFTFLQIHNLRNLGKVEVKPAPTFNLLYGANGSGKTSFFEAISYLTLGRSFRTRHNSRAIAYNQDCLSVFAQINKEANVIPIGIERHRNGDKRIRINKENKSSIIEITKMVAIQHLNPESRHLLTGYSKARRQFIDWGVFHVEPSFLSTWQQTQRILKQRNAALKSRADKKMIALWDAELGATADKLNTFRKTYVTQLHAVLEDILLVFFKNTFNLTFTYKAGWDDADDLLNILNASMARDLQLGYTQHGPHRADLLIRVNKTIPAQDVLSQGQQKLLVYALHLAQGVLLKKQTGENCIFLLDDLPAELDAENRQLVAEVLNKINAQVFITGVNREALSVIEDFPGHKVFHVEHGEIRAVP